MIYLEFLMNSHDFICLQETHTNQGILAAWSGIQGCRLFADHGQHGIGILVSMRFLELFDPDPPFEVVVPGHLSILRLRSPHGALDIGVWYAQTGHARRDRDDLRSRAVASLRSDRHVLTLIAGDFNHVARERDRYSSSTATWSDHADASEEEDFMRLIADPFGLHELEQPAPTHRNALGRSRLDRIYWNSHVANQLDRHIRCVVLEWIAHLSAHRVLSWSRTTPTRSASMQLPKLHPHIFKHPDWRRRVALAWGDHIRSELPGAPAMGPLRRLVLLKRAIREVSECMQQEGSAPSSTEPEDRLGLTMAYLRAVEDLHIDRARRLAQAYPHLRTLVDPDALAAHEHAGLRLIRDHAVELAREQLTADLRSFHQEEANLSEHARRIRRQHFSARILRLRLGTGSMLQAVESATGQVHTNPEDMAADLSSHWSHVFTARPASQSHIDEWLGRFLPAANFDSLPKSAWRVRRRDIEKAVRHSGNSAPGPDGIPYSAWRALGGFGAGALTEALNVLSTGDASQALKDAYRDCSDNVGHGFNLGILVCIPKSPAGSLPDGTDYFTPDGTRPLAVVNTDNRILAGAARHRWEPLIAEWISKKQQGFLPGRSMLQNIIDIETRAQAVAAEEQEGATYLFDFAAAFPSLSHCFLFSTLRRLGLPDCVLCFLHSLYDENKCHISLHGSLYPGFIQTAGIRQGCPLSPLLYILAAESLLHALQVVLPTSLVRAFADDTAIVVRDLRASFGVLISLFHDFEIASHLRINISKTVLIPLGDRTPAAVGQVIREAGGAWAGISVSGCGKYLGFIIGPDRASRSWDKPIKKFVDRIRMWDWTIMGLHGASVIYNIWVLPVLLFVAQLEQPPETVRRAEQWGLRRVAPGPGKWVEPNDLWRLRSAYGLPFRFRCLSWTALAAQGRVSFTEAHATGGLRISSRRSHLRAVLRLSEHLGRMARWKQWMDTAYVEVLSSALEILHRRGCGPSDAQESLSDGMPRPWPQAMMRKVHSQLQRWMSRRLELPPAGWAEERLRHKLGRWKLPGFPGRNARRVLGSLQALSGAVAPRVHSAVFRSVFNGWVTERRFQRAYEGCCRFRCGGDDSVEHYMRCRVVHDFARRRLNLDLEAGSRWQFMMLSAVPVESSVLLTQVALLHYVAYRAFNRLRHVSVPPEDHLSFLQQLLVEGVRGHRASLRVHARLWHR